MAKINQVEKLAREYVANCSDVVLAIRAVVPNAKDWTEAKCKKHFSSLYEKEPQFWRFVAEYQKEVKKHVALTAADIITKWEQIAQADVGEIVRVKTRYIPCRACLADSDRPDPDCKACKGIGLPVQEVEITDTEKLSPEARFMYDGAKMGKHGIEVKTLSRAWAFDNLAKAKGMFVEKLQLLPPAPMPALPDDPKEASAAYAEWIKGA